MIENRQNFRLRKQFEIAWSIPQRKVTGQGYVSNISISGMLFTTDRVFDPEHGMVMCFSSADVGPFPMKGTLAWFRKVGKPAEVHYQCGVRFSSQAIQSPAWHQWMEDNILKLADAQDNKILERFLNNGGEVED